MKISKQCVVIVLLLVSAQQCAYAQSHQQSSNSVVKIKTSFVQKPNTEDVTGTATGWCWNDPLHIVTALHAVAGVKSIKVYDGNNRWVNATVEKVILKADLALLKLSASLNLVPLTIEPVDPNSEKDYYIWGFPHAVFEMQGSKIDFALSQLSKRNPPTLNSILTGTSNEIKTDLTDQGYPLPEVQILRISSTIQPGQSGAPIFTKEGKVVGIADGGLYGGTASINWAMPANVYVPLLLKSNDAKPSKLPFQAILMSTTTVDKDANEEQQKVKMQKEAVQNTVVNQARSISKTRTATFQQIIRTMPKEDRENIKSIAKEYDFDMQSDQAFDIYQDFKSGSSIAMPYGEVFNVSNDWFISHNKDNSVFYAVCPWVSKNYADAKKVAMSVFTKTFPENQWDKLPEEEDEITITDEDESALYGLSRSSKDGKRKLIYYAEIDGPNLLITYINADASKIEDDEASAEKYAQYIIAMNMAEIGNKKEVKEETKTIAPVKNTSTVYKTTSTKSYDEMLSAMTPADITYYKKRTADSKLDMSALRFDLYQDSKTGARLPMPSGEKTTVYPNGWVHSNNSDVSIFYSALPFEAGSYENAKKGAVSTFQSGFPETTWKADPKFTSPPEVVNDAEQKARYAYYRVSADGRYLYYQARVMGSVLLVTYLTYFDARIKEPEYYKKYLHFFIALQQSDFGKK